MFFGASRGEASYQEAQAFFAKKQYSQAAPKFFQSYAYPANKNEKMKSEWGLAESLRRLGLLYSSSKYYSIIVRRGPSASNAFFRQALEELGRVNNLLSLGQSHIVQLFKTKIPPEKIPGAARGFYFHYQGVESYIDGKFEKADSYFRLVPESSEYYVKALFHRGVIANLSGKYNQAKEFFGQVRSLAKRERDSSIMVDLADMNTARVLYEQGSFRESIGYYARIPRFSEYWLQALFESAWSFFMMQKHNNTLGNLHTIQSPFFNDRFYPESYILQAVTFLRLCRYSEVKNAMLTFKDRHLKLTKELKGILGTYRGDYQRFFKIIYDYQVGSLKKYSNTWPVFDFISRVDAFKEAQNTIRFSDREIARLSNVKGVWVETGLSDELKQFLNQKKSLAIASAGKHLYSQAADAYAYLMDLSRQTDLINAEMLLGKVDELRAKLKIGTADKKAVFIGGMQAFNPRQDLEYWPFEGEYWKDELGGYVYNLASKCSGGGKDN